MCKHKMKILVLDWQGSKSELQKMLSAGLTIQKIQEDSAGGYLIEYEPKRGGGRPARYSKEQILQLRVEEKSFAEIAEIVGCTKTYVIKVCKQLAREQRCDAESVSKESAPSHGGSKGAKRRKMDEVMK